MKLKYFLCFISVLSYQLEMNLSAQGFSPNPITWSVPTGGAVTYPSEEHGFHSTFHALAHYTNDHGWTTMDINGDNKPDLVVTGQADGAIGTVFGFNDSPHWKVYLSTSSGFSANPITWSVPTGGAVTYPSDDHGFYSTSHALAHYNNDHGWTTTDINGDNKPDLVVTGQADGTVGRVFGFNNSPYWKVYLNTGSGFSSNPITWSVPTGGAVTYPSDDHGFYSTSHALAHYNNDHGWATIDMNGDNKPDLVVTGQADGTVGRVFGFNNSPYWKVYLNTGSGFSANPTTWSVPIGGAVTYPSEEHGFHSTFHALAHYNNDHGWTTTDMNGDNKPDLVVTGEADGIVGTVFDFNNSPYWKVYLNTDSGFSSNPITWSVPIGGAVTYPSDEHGFHSTFHALAHYNNDHGWTTIDINGDNKPDLVVTGQADGTVGTVFGFNDSPYWKVYFNTASGFSSNPITWSVPTGGAVTYPSEEHGFHSTFHPLAHYNNDHGWTTMDINGDDKPDLVVTGQADGTVGTVFDFNNSPYWKVYLNESSTTGILNENRNPENLVKIYPIPCRHILNVDISLVSNPEIRIYDYLGKLLYQETNKNGNIVSIDCNVFGQGVFPIEIISDEGSFKDIIIVK